VIESFVDSWELFHNTYLAGWFMAILLAVAGVVVVGRDQIFIGAALSEASTLGISIGLWLAAQPALHDLGWLESPLCLQALACAFALLAAALTARAGAGGHGGYEALAGWIFLLGGSLSILFVYHTPHGLEEVHHLLSGSLIGLTEVDAWVAGAAAGAALLLAAAFRRPILAVVLDEEMAQAAGMNVGAWNLGLSAAVALAVSFCLRASGLPYTFGCLVLPALAARSLARRPGAVFVLAPAIALATCVLASVAANRHDQPPGQMSVALLCVVAALAAGWRRIAGH
jgi:ABC-type Mn2+/Zn2+ transport system permease subunit